MKHLRYWILCGATIIFLAPSVFAQDGKAKARLAEIRAAYTEAMNLAKSNQDANNKNTMVFQSVQTDPGGVWKRKLDFIYSLAYFEELDFYYPVVKLIRQTNDTSFQEFLYDEDGVLMFVFERIPPLEEGDPTLEYRYYYDGGVPFWRIFKSVDPASKKVLENSQGGIEEADGSAYFLTRVATDLHAAFEALTVMYE